MRKLIDARGAKDPMAEFAALIVNDNCSASEGIEVWVNGESTAKKLSLFTSILGYENRIGAKDGYWVLKVEVGPCLCPVSA
jgi:hypothetical protein